MNTRPRLVRRRKGKMYWVTEDGEFAPYIGGGAPEPDEDPDDDVDDEDDDDIKLEEDTVGQASYNSETGESSFAASSRPDEEADQEPRAFNYGDAALSSEESNTEDEDANQHHI